MKRFTCRTGIRRMFMLSYQWFGALGIVLVLLFGTIISFCTGKRVLYLELTSSQTTSFTKFYKMKEFSDNSFKCDENGGSFSKRVENNVGKGEIARYEQFLLFPQCFQKTCTGDT